MIRRMDSKGVIAIIAAFAIPTMLLLIGGAVDLTRIYIVKQRAQTGVDAAALVIGAEGTSDDPSKGKADAEKIFWNNFKPGSTLENTGVLDSTIVTMDIGDYNASTKQVPVTVTVSIPLLFSILQKSGAATISAVGYANFDKQSGTGRGWMALFCYTTSDASPPTACQSQNNPGYAALHVVPSSTNPVIIDGPVCYSDKSYSGELGTACLSSSAIVNQPSLTLTTNATLTAQNTDTDGNSCSHCDTVLFDGGFNVNAGTTTITAMNIDNHGSTSITNSTLTVEENATYSSSSAVTLSNAAYNGLTNGAATVHDNTTLTNSTLSLDSNAQYCDNGITASNSSVTATNGSSLGCTSNSEWQGWTIQDSSKLLLSSSASLYIRGGDALTLDASTFDINSSLANIGVSAGVNLKVNDNSIVTIENSSTLYVYNYLVIQGGSSFTSSSSNISVSGLQLNSPGTLNLGHATTFVVTGKSGNNNISDKLNISGGSTATIAGYTPISGATINVTDTNSSLAFSGQTDISNSTINVSNGGIVTFNNATSFRSVVINVSSGGSVIFKNVNGYNASGISGIVNGSQSSVTFSVSSQNGSLHTNLTSQNGGVISVTYP